MSDCQGGITTPELTLRCSEPVGHPPPHLMHLASEEYEAIITITWYGPAEMVDMRPGEPGEYTGAYTQPMRYAIEDEQPGETAFLHRPAAADDEPDGPLHPYM